MREGLFALIIAILGCQISSGEMKEGEMEGMRRYPETAEDAFKCYNGSTYSYISRTPASYDYHEHYQYKRDKKKVI